MSLFSSLLVVLRRASSERHTYIHTRITRERYRIKTIEREGRSKREREREREEQGKREKRERKKEREDDNADLVFPPSSTRLCRQRQRRQQSRRISTNLFVIR